MTRTGLNPHNFGEPLRRRASEGWPSEPASTYRWATWPRDRLVALEAEDYGEATLVAVHDRGLRPESSLVRRSTLEDVFLRLTGRSLVD